MNRPKDMTPILTTADVLAWLQEKFTQDELKKLGHASYEAAAIRYFAWREYETGCMNDFSARDWIELIAEGMPGLTLESVDDDLKCAREEDPEEEWDMRAELEQFWLSESSDDEEDEDE